MGFFNSLKGKSQVGTDDLTPNQSTYSNDQYASGTHDELSTKEEKRRMFGNSSSKKPFSSSQSTQPDTDSFQPPPNPPPSHRQAETFAPPSHPPPSHQKSDTFSPPPGPPPSANPPPYHDWTVIPDTALLPPPPAAPQSFSTNNATYESAESAHAWCFNNPPFTPSVPNSTIHDASVRGNLELVKPSTLLRTATLKKTTEGTYTLKTRRGQPDTILLSNLPLYFAALDNPLHTERQKDIYFELRILTIGDAESGVAIGFAAQPYPNWRLPGWHRGSIGIHGDDGRRFTNDSGGGRDFVGAFEGGDVVGVGVRFLVEDAGSGRCKTKAFFTRNGREEGSWEMDEERDAESDGVEGLMGEGDLYPAIGVFGGMEVEVRFRREDWGWRG